MNLVLFTSVEFFALSSGYQGIIFKNSLVTIQSTLNRAYFNSFSIYDPRDAALKRFEYLFYWLRILFETRETFKFCNFHFPPHTRDFFYLEKHLVHLFRLGSCTASRR